MKRIICLVVFILLLGASAVYAGQEEPCDHESYIVTYNSSEEQLSIFCNDCGESHYFKIDHFFVDKFFEEIW